MQQLTRASGESNSMFRDKLREKLGDKLNESQMTPISSKKSKSRSLISPRTDAAAVMSNTKRSKKLNICIEDAKIFSESLRPRKRAKATDTKR